MKWKRFLAACCVGAALLTGVASAGVFADTPPAWAAEHMDSLWEKGLLSGIYPENISTTQPITRGEFCQLLVNLVQEEMTTDQFNAFPPKEASYFWDIKSYVTEHSPEGPYDMYYAAAYGITEGAMFNGYRRADPDVLLTREQAAKMMCSAVDFLEENVVGGALMAQGAPKTFADAAAISSWAAAYVDQASALGIMKGDERGSFNPAGTITWNEAGVMVSRAMDAADNVRIGQVVKEGGSVLLSQVPHRASPDDTFWLSLSDNGCAVVWESGRELQVETFAASGSSGWTSQGVRTLPAELPLLGGFCVGEDGYYAAYGQENREESDGKEVYRIVKYDRNWNRVGAASITGGESHTIQPFRATDHTALAEEDGVLVLHTARLRYISEDGLNHQSNFTARIRTSDMTVLETSDPFPDNHVSHSFAQDVIFADGAPVYADLGDAYPRALTISQSNGAQQEVLPIYGAIGDNTTQDVIFADGAPVYADLGDAYPRALTISQSNGAQQEVLPIYGAIGDNTTHAALGGLAASDGCYLLAGASAPQDGPASWKAERMNALLAVTPKDGFPNGKARIQWLTDFSDGKQWVENVRLVAVNDNTFVVLWQVAGPNNALRELCYAVFDGQGNQTGKTRTLPGGLFPAGNVAVKDRALYWVGPDRGLLSRSYGSTTNKLMLFCIDVDANAATGSAQVSFDLTPSALELTAGGKGEQLTARCSGLSGDRPQITYRSSNSAVAYVDGEGTVTGRSAGTAGGKGEQLTARCSGLSGDRPQITYRSSNSAVAYVDGEGTVTGRSAGAATITASMTYRGRTYTDACAVTVTPKPTLTGLTLTPSSATLKVGETLDLTAETVPAGLNTTVVWSYAGSLQARDNLHAVYTAQKAGTDTITVSASDSSGRRHTASCTITVTEAAAPEGQPGSGQETGTQPDAGNTGGDTGTRPDAGNTGSSGPVSSEPYDTDFYREEYGSGYYLEIRAEGDTVEISGCLNYDVPGLNYVVAWAPGRNVAELPYVIGQPFHGTVQVDGTSVRQSAQEGKLPYLTLMLCQNYEPGDSALAGVGFQEADIGLVPDGESGFLFRVMPE